MDKQEYFNHFNGLYTSKEVVLHKLMYIISKDAHRGSTRKTGERYFEHPRSVSLLLRKKGFTSLNYHLVALGHDLLEDTEITVDMIELMFGTEVARDMVLLTKLPGESMTYYLLRVNQSKVVATVKMADKIANLLDVVDKKTPESFLFSKEKISEWKEEGRRLIDSFEATFGTTSLTREENLLKEELQRQTS